MNRKVTLVAAVTLLAVIAAGIAVIYDDSDQTTANTNDPVKGTILIMDQYGVYQLVDATGTNVTTAMQSVDELGLIDITISSTQGNKLTEVNGLKGATE